MFPKPFLHMRTFKLKLDFCKQGEKNELSPIKPKILFRNERVIGIISQFFIYTEKPTCR